MKKFIVFLCFLTAGTSAVAQVNSISVDNSSPSIAVLGSVQLSVSFLPVGTSSTLTWATSNSDIAVVTSSGLVYGLAKGKATITVTESGGQTATSIVTVTDSKEVEEYPAIFATTNFVVPLVRFNLLEKTSQFPAIGNTSFFNSVGAGFSFNFGKLSITKTAGQESQLQEFENRIGIQVGCLFAANSSAQNNANIFAPTLSLTFLNFQVGSGYECGNIGTTDTRFFFTIAYGIPIPKLIRGGYWPIRIFDQNAKKKKRNNNNKVFNSRMPTIFN